jgi:hypothetical protein
VTCEESVRRAAAYHQTAQAIVNYRAAGHAGGVISIARRRDGDILGSTDGISDSFTAKELEARVLSCYAGGHAQRLVDPGTGESGCDQDDEIAAQLLAEFGWQQWEQELRRRSLELVQRHWGEIIAVAEELLRAETLDDEEVEILADAAGGERPDGAAALAEYRALRKRAEEGQGTAH